MSAPLYRLDRVEVTYGERTVLAVEQLDVREHETLVVVGPNGAGKSTLLRLLNFLEPPTAGSILFRGKPIDWPPPLPLRRRITTLFQRPALLSRPVWDNICYGLRLRGAPAGSMVGELLEQLDLLGLTNAPAGDLSGGEAQRVALARALAVGPEVLLLDEPTANLDPYNLSVVEGMIQRLRAERSRTLVVVTHNVFQARRLADRVAMLHEGRLIELAAADRFFDRPHDPRAAAFVRGELVA